MNFSNEKPWVPLAKNPCEIGSGLKAKDMGDMSERRTVTRLPLFEMHIHYGTKVSPYIELPQ